MNNKKPIIDHIVLTVVDFESDTEFFGEQFGVEPILGGKHPGKGTQNALINLGNECYLEIIGPIEPTDFSLVPRWMAIDHIDLPRVTRWALKSNDLESDVEILRAIDPELCIIDEGSRQTSDGTDLSWRMSRPLLDAMCCVHPFFVDWGDSVHPTAHLPDVCKLVKLRIRHPQPASIQPFMDNINFDVIVEEYFRPEMKIIVDSPNGLKEF